MKQNLLNVEEQKNWINKRKIRISKKQNTNDFATKELIGDLNKKKNSNWQIKVVKGNKNDAKQS